MADSIDPSAGAVDRLSISKIDGQRFRAESRKLSAPGRVSSNGDYLVALVQQRPHHMAAEKACRSSYQGSHSLMVARIMEAKLRLETVEQAMAMWDDAGTSHDRHRRGRSHVAGVHLVHFRWLVRYAS